MRIQLNKAGRLWRDRLSCCPDGTLARTFDKLVSGDTSIERIDRDVVEFKVAFACAFLERIGARLLLLTGYQFGVVHDLGAVLVPLSRGAEVSGRVHDGTLEWSGQTVEEPKLLEHGGLQFVFDSKVLDPTDWYDERPVRDLLASLVVDSELEGFEKLSGLDEGQIKIAYALCLIRELGGALVSSARAELSPEHVLGEALHYLSIGYALRGNYCDEMRDLGGRIVRR